MTAAPMNLHRLIADELLLRGWRICAPLDINTIGTPVRYWKDPLGGDPVGLNAAIARELRREKHSRLQQFADRRLSRGAGGEGGAR